MGIVSPHLPRKRKNLFQRASSRLIEIESLGGKLTRFLDADFGNRRAWWRWRIPHWSRKMWVIRDLKYIWYIFYHKLRKVRGMGPQNKGTLLSVSGVPATVFLKIWWDFVSDSYKFGGPSRIRERIQGLPEGHLERSEKTFERIFGSAVRRTWNLKVFLLEIKGNCIQVTNIYMLQSHSVETLSSVSWKTGWLCCTCLLTTTSAE